MAVAVCVCATPAFGDVPPGFDLFETDPEATVFSFREEFTIPPNFFDEGSAPFQGDVNFGGVPLNTFQGHDVGGADAILHRFNPAVLAPPFPDQTIIPVDLVSLSLIGVLPITVDVGNDTQLWDVRMGVSPSRFSQGALRINQTSPQGGAFDSALQVFPLFTFRRLSDGETRTLDVGQFPADPQTSDDLVLRSDNQPWRAGCVPPALAVPGLNDSFCAGQTEAGVLQLNPLQSRLVRLGVRPAQAALEHFGCYLTREPRRFKRRDVTVEDQFGSGRGRVVAQRGLCVPVRKNREPFENTRAHLQCYASRLSPGFSARTVAVRNQFGAAVLRISRPTALCAPSVKTPLRRRGAPDLGAAERIDHFACYRARPAARLRLPRVSFRGQFGRERVRVLRPINLCAPAAKNGVAVEHPVRHLVCYEFRRLGRRPFRPRSVRVRNQFGSRVVRVLAPGLLCVPSLKIVV